MEAKRKLRGGWGCGAVWEGGRDLWRKGGRDVVVPEKHERAVIRGEEWRYALGLAEGPERWDGDGKARASCDFLAFSFSMIYVISSVCGNHCIDWVGSLLLISRQLECGFGNGSGVFLTEGNL